MLLHPDIGSSGHSFAAILELTSCAINGGQPVVDMAERLT